MLADVRDRLTSPGAVLVPDSCVTMAGAVAIRELIPELGFSIDSRTYLERIFAHVGHPFDVRLTILDASADDLVTDAGPVESLFFNGAIVTDGSEEVILRVTRSGYIDGVLLWVLLTCRVGDAPVDTLRQRTNWVPAYLPAFGEPVRVHAGDTVRVLLNRALSDDGIHPDYELEMSVRTVELTTSGRFRSSHHGPEFRSAPLYQELFGTAS